jgi:hypothetical protein
MVPVRAILGHRRVFIRLKGYGSVHSLFRGRRPVVAEILLADLSPRKFRSYVYFHQEDRFLTVHFLNARSKLGYGTLARADDLNNNRFLGSAPVIAKRRLERKVLELLRR